jgi:hypothetical protein
MGATCTECGFQMLSLEDTCPICGKAGKGDKGDRESMTDDYSSSTNSMDVMLDELFS